MPARVCVADTDASLISSSLGNGAVDNAQFPRVSQVMLHGQLCCQHVFVLLD